MDRTARPFFPRQAKRALTNNANLGLSQGRIYYADALAMITDGAQSAGDPARSILFAELQGSSELEQYRFTDLYGFANDTWRAGPRLVLSYGTGYNLYSGAIYGRKTDKNNFAPFASFAFAPTHSESVILRGGAAILYAPPTRLPYGEISATPLYPVATGFARPSEITGTPLPRAWTQRDGVVDIEQAYANEMRTGYTESAFFFVQRSIGDRLIIEAGYNSTFGHRLTQAYRIGRGRVDLPANDQMSCHRLGMLRSTYLSRRSSRSRKARRSRCARMFSTPPTESTSRRRLRISSARTSAAASKRGGPALFGWC